MISEYKLYNYETVEREFRVGMIQSRYRASINTNPFISRSQLSFLRMCTCRHWKHEASVQLLSLREFSGLRGIEVTRVVSRHYTGCLNETERPFETRRGNDSDLLRIVGRGELATHERSQVRLSLFTLDVT